MAKSYVIERRVVLAQRTDVFWYAGPASIGGSRWDTNRENAVQLSFKDASAALSKFRDAARAFGDQHIFHNRHPAQEEQHAV